MTGMSYKTIRLSLITLCLILLSSTQAGNADSLGLNQVQVTWEEKVQSTAPQGRTGENFVYDTIRNVSFMFGGYDDDIDNNAWSFDGSTNKWTEIQTTNQLSVFRLSASAFDKQDDKILTFGGSENGSPHDQTWSFDFTSKVWTQMTPNASPSKRWHASMVYDSKNDRMILFGGSYLNTILGDTWSYDYSTDNWTQLSPQSSPSARGGHSMVYDPVGEKVVMFGGWGGIGVNAPLLNDTWEFNVNTNEWTMLDDGVAGLARGNAGMVYDATNKGLILFGGGNHGYLDDTWFFNRTTNNWNQLTTTDNPSARTLRGGMTYDISNQKVVLFGGYDGSTYYNDTWEFTMEMPVPAVIGTFPPTSSSVPEAPSSNSKDSPITPTFILLGFIIVPIIHKLNLRSKKRNR